MLSYPFKFIHFTYTYVTYTYIPLQIFNMHSLSPFSVKFGILSQKWFNINSSFLSICLQLRTWRMSWTVMFSVFLMQNTWKLGGSRVNEILPLMLYVPSCFVLANGLECAWNLKLHVFHFRSECQGGAVLTVCIVRFLTDDIIIDKSRSFPYPSRRILICYAADDFWLVLMLFTQMPGPTIFNT